MGSAAEWSLSLAEDRSRRFRRLVALSAVGHVTVAALLLWAPRPASHPALPAVVRVDLHAALPSLPAPAPKAPAAKPPEPAPPPPVAEPKPKPPVPEKVVLPEKPKPVPKPKPRPAAKPQPRVEKKPPPPPPKSAASEESYEDFMASLRAEREARQPRPAAPTAMAQGRGGPSGPGVVLPPEVVAWMRRAKVHVTRAWVLAPDFRTLPLQTEIAVRVAPTGEVLTTRITRRSGNPWFDQSVERAIRKASPLPAPPDAAEWTFVFRPEDVL